MSVEMTLLITNRNHAFSMGLDICGFQEEEDATSRQKNHAKNLHLSSRVNELYGCVAV